MTIADESGDANATPSYRNPVPGQSLGNQQTLFPPWPVILIENHFRQALSGDGTETRALMKMITNQVDADARHLGRWSRSTPIPVAGALLRTQGTLMVEHRFDGHVVCRTMAALQDGVLTTAEAALELAHGCASCTIRNDLLVLFCVSSTAATTLTA